jgi:hypothetical protein
MPVDDDPAVAAKRRDLEQLMGLAQRNASLEPAVTALRQEIDSMISRPRPSPDVAILSAMSSDPAFFSGASPEEQRGLFELVLSSVVVARGGEAHAQLRSW